MAHRPRRSWSRRTIARGSSNTFPIRTSPNRPGADVDGAAVTPADLGGSLRIARPREIKIPIQIDLQKKFGVPTETTLFSTSDTTVGTVTYRDGRLWYDGQPLQDEETARIAKLCRQKLR